ncbi:hypothetical protein Dsin_022740 [Dipteronia sinensis]|uniref:Apple domain-containing protein n=1 Tax=Dipteronia sinensis TaxID=43782 RepID=A0AAE0A2I4_9ROSI|nr:hypothetical protein Dsin_022740 [Dipteronia sinensis]
MDPKQPNEYFIMSGSQILWRSGVWISNQNTFAMVPEMRLNYIFNYGLYGDENETYFRYSVKDSTISRLLLDMTGQIKQSNYLDVLQSWFLFWAQPREPCDSYAYCGSFTSCNYQIGETFCQCLQGFRPSDSLKRLNQSSGCVRRIPLQCEDNSVNGDKDRFLRMNDVIIPSGAKESRVQAAEECKLACYNDCACTAYAYIEIANSVPPMIRPGACSVNNVTLSLIEPR